MGRIRTVKPDLFKHDDLFEAEAQTGLPLRVAFIGLFTVCDREGRFKWKPRRLKIDVLPFDELDFSRVLHALLTRGFLVRYANNNEEYGCIPSFCNHQIINNKESKSTFPGHEDDGSMIKPAESLEHHDVEINRTTREPRVAHASTTRLNFTQGERKGKEGKGREGVVSNDTCPAEAEPSAPKANHAEKIQDVFSHWQTVLNHPQANLDDKRRTFIRNALKSGYTVDQLKQAIDGCSRTPHNMGDNDRHQVYDGIHIIFKSADQIDRFIGNAGSRLVSQMSKAGRSTQAAGEALMAEMFGEDTHGY